jgi:hypothetical protein
MMSKKFTEKVEVRSFFDSIAKFVKEKNLISYLGSSYFLSQAQIKKFTHHSHKNSLNKKSAASMPT